MLFVVAVDVLNEFDERTTGWEIVSPLREVATPLTGGKPNPLGVENGRANW